MELAISRESCDNLRVGNQVLERTKTSLWQFFDLKAGQSSTRGEPMMILPHDPFRNAKIAALFCVAFMLIVKAAPAIALDPDIPQTQTRAQEGSIQRQIELAAAYLTGHGVLKDETQAAYWYEKAAEAGDPEAQKEIGYFYQIGLGVPIDPVRAVHWYQLAAAGGLLSGKVNLGVAYVWGIGVPRNAPLGEQLFREAAEKGSGLGACYLGEMYYSGIGVKQDTAAAEHWFAIGTKLHEPRAAFRLGSLLSTREDRPRNFPKAAEVLRKSADEGYVPAMHALGLLLANHPELPKSAGEVVALLHEAANAGNWKSSATLGVLARDGNETTKDDKRAYFYFRAATLQGGESARQLLQNDLRIKTAKIGTTEAARIDRETDAWFQQHRLVLEFVSKGGDNWKRFPAFALAVPAQGIFAGKLIPAQPYAPSDQSTAPDREVNPR